MATLAKVTSTPGTWYCPTGGAEELDAVAGAQGQVQPGGREVDRALAQLLTAPGDVHGQPGRLVEPTSEALDEAFGHVLGDDDRGRQVGGQVAQDGGEGRRSPGRGTDRDDQRPVPARFGHAAMAAAGCVMVLRLVLLRVVLLAVTRAPVQDDCGARPYGRDGCRRSQRFERTAALRTLGVPRTQPGPGVGDHRDTARDLQAPDEGLGVLGAVRGRLQRADDVDCACGERSLRLAGGVTAHDDRRGASSHDPLDGLEPTVQEVEVEQHGGWAPLGHQPLGGLGVARGAGDLETGAGHQAFELAGSRSGRDHDDGHRRARDGACDVHRRHVALRPSSAGSRDVLGTRSAARRLSPECRRAGGKP